MTAKQFYFILLIVTLFFQNCKSDGKKTTQTSSPETTAAPTTQEPSASVEQVAAETQEKKESPLGKSTEQLRENKTNRIGTVPTGKDAELNTTIPAPPVKIESKRVERAGSPAYISKKDAILQAEPSPNASKIANLKQYETVYILETKMTDESGKTYDVPQWYKIQRSEGQKGWIKSQFVGLPF